eukprot:CAMPEP_0184313746 /NCGR_PEP_ID=MMETSP1049-20130417/67116_1 /TAXON_ID=77928 /ORGANISM="Proteomonas sulcata, Strain CCMP704" /LENGTH=56 /DNA_ID=CAMNT_0026631215 /DNA_START=213 /DNA_END=380 /DNA_ORIENTATION=+
MRVLLASYLGPSTAIEPLLTLLAYGGEGAVDFDGVVPWQALTLDLSLSTESTGTFW